MRLYTHMDASQIVQTHWMYNIIDEYNAETADQKGYRTYVTWELWVKSMAKKYNATYNDWNCYFDFEDERDITRFLLRWS